MTISQIACVMHLAGFKAVAESIDYPLAYYANNVGGFLQLIEVCPKSSYYEEFLLLGVQKRKSV